jgi:hypothetical protein
MVFVDILRSMTTTFDHPHWRVVKGWQYAVLYTGEPFGFPNSVTSAEIKVCEQNGVWEIALSVSDINGNDVGFIISRYTSDGSLMDWRRTFSDGQVIKAQSIARSSKNGVAALDVVSLDSEGGVRHSQVPLDLDTLEPSPSCLLRSAFASLNVGDSGSFLTLALNHFDLSEKWVKLSPIKWRIDNDVVMTSEGNIEVWRLEGIEEHAECSYTVFVGKVNQDILRLDMNNSKGALMFARAGT